MTVMFTWKNKWKYVQQKSFTDAEYSGFMYKKKKEGPGTLLSKDGSIYEGNFSDDLKSGHGRLIDNYGNVWEAIWENDI